MPFFNASLRLSEFTRIKVNASIVSFLGLFTRPMSDLELPDHCRTYAHGRLIARNTMR